MSQPNSAARPRLPERASFKGLRRSIILIYFAAGLLVSIALCAAESTGSPAKLRVLAAASLSDALEEIARDFGQIHAIKVAVNSGASSQLARQIIEGAPADIFFSADQEKMDALETKNLLEPNTRRAILSNTLVIVAPADSDLKVESAERLLAPQFTRIAIAEPSTVPAGIYARKFLEKKDLFEKLKPKLLATDNVRAALATVESGNADSAFVYATDVAISKKVKVLFAIPTADAPPIVYPAAVLRDASHKEAALEFMEYLQSVDASRVFRKFGFIVPQPQPLSASPTK